MSRRILVRGRVAGRSGRAIAVAFADPGRPGRGPLRQARPIAPGRSWRRCQGDGPWEVPAAAHHRLRDVRPDGRLLLADQLGDLDVVSTTPASTSAPAGRDRSWEDWQAAWEQTLQTNLLGRARDVRSDPPLIEATGGGGIIATSRGAFPGEPQQSRLRRRQGRAQRHRPVDGEGAAPNRVLLGVAVGLVTDMSRDPLEGPEGTPSGPSRRWDGGPSAEIAAAGAFLACDDST